jgi:hypothetical protein
LVREGELFGLRKQDVNWKTNEITVRRSWDAETTKSRRERSTVEWVARRRRGDELGDRALLPYAGHAAHQVEHG